MGVGREWEQESHSCTSLAYSTSQSLHFGPGLLRLLDSDQGHVMQTATSTITATNAELWQAARISVKVTEPTVVICSGLVLSYQQKMKRLVSDIDECWALCGNEQV